MFKKMCNKVLKMNLKKSFIGLLAAVVIFAAGSGIALYQNFGGRVSEFKELYDQQRQEMMMDFTQHYQKSEQQEQETGREMDTFRKHHKDGDWDMDDWYKEYLYQDMEQKMNITIGDKVMVGVILGIGAMLELFYWIFCMAWAYQKAGRIGGNVTFWVIATLFFNLWAVAALYVYAYAKGTCKNCGHLKSKNEKYCSHCGTAYQTVCKNCNAPVQSDAKFCPNCGKTIQKEASDVDRDA